MLYSVEIAFTNTTHEADWNAWYETHLATLLSVPGFHTAQRFHSPSKIKLPYLALYSIESLDVLQSQAYRDVGGGGAAVGRFAQYRLRARNLFSGIDRFPAVTQEMCVVMTDRPPAQLDLRDILFTPLRAEALDRSVERRYISVVGVALGRALSLSEIEGVGVYHPTNTRRLASWPAA